MRTGLTSVPKAERTEAFTGKITRSASSSSATPQAWTGPAPPNAIRGTPRTSSPRSTACIRAAAAMFWFTTVCTPTAVSWVVLAMSDATLAMAASAAARSRLMSPPRKKSGSR